jgi:hypothetical protein
MKLRAKCALRPVAMVLGARRREPGSQDRMPNLGAEDRKIRSSRCAVQINTPATGQSLRFPELPVTTIEVGEDS